MHHSTLVLCPGVSRPRRWNCIDGVGANSRKRCGAEHAPGTAGIAYRPWSTGRKRSACRAQARARRPYRAAGRAPGADSTTWISCEPVDRHAREEYRRQCAKAQISPYYRHPRTQTWPIAGFRGRPTVHDDFPQLVLLQDGYFRAVIAVSMLGEENIAGRFGNYLRSLPMDQTFDASPAATPDSLGAQAR
jgi:hypothetical protein